MTEGSSSRPTPWLRAAGAIAVVILMVVGIIVLGRLASSDVMAMVLTTVFFGVLFAAIAWVALRQRAWLVPLGLPFVLVALIAGVLLGRPLVTDNVVNEEIVVADAVADDVADAAATPSAPAATAVKPTPKPKSTSADKPAAASAPAPAPAPTKAAPKNVKLASGSFKAIAHPGTGTATLIRTASGEVKLTFANFSTENGPDVRVYLSRDTKASGRGSSFVELGALKGNKGNQQYSVPSSVNLSSIDSIVLWCRAFDVGFIQAPLTKA